MRRKLRNERPHCIWGAVIPAIASLAGSVYSSWANKKAQETQFEEQQRLQAKQNLISSLSSQTNSLNNYFGTIKPDETYYQYPLGGIRRGNDLHITDGGDAVPLGNNTFLLRGGSHEDINESGRTGIGLEANGRPFEAQGGEVIKNNGNNIEIFSNEIPYKNTGRSIAQAVATGEVSPSAASKLQKAFKKHYGLNDDGTMKVSRGYINRRNRLKTTFPVEGRRQAPLGAEWYLPDYVGLGVNVLGSVLARRYANSNYDSMARMYDNTVLPDFYAESYVAPDTQYDKYVRAKFAEAQKSYEEEKGAISKNTASSSDALSRIQDATTNRDIAINKVLDEAAQKNFEARLKGWEGEQQTRARNAQARNSWSAARAEMANQMLRDKIGLYSSKVSDNIGMIQGLGSSIGSFLQAGVDNYQNRIAKALITSTALGQTPERVNTYVPGFFGNKEAKRFYDQRLREYNSNPTEEGANLVNYWANQMPDKYRLRYGISPVSYSAPATNATINNVVTPPITANTNYFNTRGTYLNNYPYSTLNVPPLRYSMQNGRLYRRSIKTPSFTPSYSSMLYGR